MAKKWRVLLILLFVIVSGSAFPIYNFGKHYTQVLAGILLYLNIVCYLELGIFEKRVYFSSHLPSSKIWLKAPSLL